MSLKVSSLKYSIKYQDSLIWFLVFDRGCKNRGCTYKEPNKKFGDYISIFFLCIYYIYIFLLIFGYKETLYFFLNMIYFIYKCITILFEIGRHKYTYLIIIFFFKFWDHLYIQVYLFKNFTKMCAIFAKILERERMMEAKDI